MDYYDEIKKGLIENEINRRIKTILLIKVI